MELTKVQIEKAKNCKTIEELKELAKNEGLNLTDEDVKTYFNATRVGELDDDDLDKVAGGAKGWVLTDRWQYDLRCPFCGAGIFIMVDQYENSNRDFKHELTPNRCGCGAEIVYADTTMNFLFTKNGETKIVHTR